MEQNRFLAESKILYDRVFHFFDNIDPDIVEADIAQDNITLLFADGIKYIINRQSSVQQIWLATKSKGLHFDFDEDSKKWICDKSREEFFTVLAKHVSKKIKQPVKFE